MADETKEAPEVELQEAEIKRRLFLTTPATASWKLSQDDFRRIARTGEHAPAAQEAQS